MQTLGVGVKGNSLSRVGAIQAPCHFPHPQEPRLLCSLGRPLLEKVTLCVPKALASRAGHLWWGGLLAEVNAPSSEYSTVGGRWALRWELRPEKGFPAGGVHNDPAPPRLLPLGTALLALS